MGNKKPQQAQQQADVVPGAAQHGMQRITQRSFEWISSCLPSLFMCPMVGSIALRLLIIAFIVRVTPRRWPDLRICTPSTCAPF
jgi:hypothetical protein